MNRTTPFPAVWLKGGGLGFEAVSGLRLLSILKGDLALGDARQEGRPSQTSRLDPKVQQKSWEDLLHALYGWPTGCVLELHLTSLPDLGWRARSELRITLLIRVHGSKEEEVKEEVMSRYLALVPLLEAHLPEAEFAPVTDMEELRERMQPFAARRAVAIHRRDDVLLLSRPLERVAVGFGSSSLRGGEDGEVVVHLWPWVPSYDDWGRLAGTLMGQLEPVHIIVRVRVASPDQRAFERLEEVVRACELFLSGCKERHLTLSRQAGLVRDVSVRQLVGLDECRFDVGVFVLAPYDLDGSVCRVVGSAVTGSNALTKDQPGFCGGFACTEVTVPEALDLRYFPEKEPCTLTEAACAFRLPHPPTEDQPGLPLKRHRTNLALPSACKADGPDSLELVWNQHRSFRQPVFVSAEDRMRHTFLIGQTGTGKSTLMESMILQDVRAGRGVAVIDPHGESVESVLGRIPPHREEDVILFDLLDRQRPLGFNMLEWRTVEERDLIIDELYLTLDRIYDMKATGGPIFENNFRGMLKLLMGGRHDGDFVPTILEFIRCYLSKGFRDWLRNRTEDPTALDFLTELERTTGDMCLNALAPYVTSKFSRFVQDTTLIRIVGQERSSLDFDEIMNEGKILLVNLGKGRFGATVSALIANHLVARFKLAAMKRGDLRPEERRDFFLYVDECHNLPQDNFMELLAEARKYRLGLVLATQYAAQLSGARDGRDSLLAAILGNVGTTLIFRLGLEDATQMGNSLYPYFSKMDIVGLPNWKGYARMTRGWEAAQPFSFASRKDAAPYDGGVAARVREASREKYGRDLETIDSRIARRRSIWKRAEDRD